MEKPRHAGIKSHDLEESEPGFEPRSPVLEPQHVNTTPLKDGYRHGAVGMLKHKTSVLIVQITGGFKEVLSSGS